MPRIYDGTIGVGAYADAIDNDPAHSPFVLVELCELPPAVRRWQEAEVRLAWDEGFALVDHTGRIVGRGDAAVYVCAPHVAQRERGGRFPTLFDRERGARCQFAADKRLDLLEDQIALAWAEWMAPASSVGQDWTDAEVTALVEDYFSMLRLELSGQPHSKSEHRAALSGALPGRSKGSLEFKHQNVSAVLRDMSLPFIEGYKPRGNYQKLLGDVVTRWIEANPSFLTQLAEGTPAATDALPALTRVAPPPVSAAPGAGGARQLPTIRNYDALARENSRLGSLGECAVVAHEREALAAAGRADLAYLVEHVSKTRGDGLGYDILSFAVDGTPLQIEVKTTKGGRTTPFFVTAAEIAASKTYQDTFRLYRLFSFMTSPLFFVLEGDVSQHVDLQPSVFRASFTNRV